MLHCSELLRFRERIIDQSPKKNPGIINDGAGVLSWSGRLFTE
jgi:hypothetical protein